MSSELSVRMTPSEQSESTYARPANIDITAGIEQTDRCELGRWVHLGSSTVYSAFHLAMVEGAKGKG